MPLLISNLYLAFRTIVSAPGLQLSNTTFARFGALLKLYVNPNVVPLVAAVNNDSNRILVSSSISTIPVGLFNNLVLLQSLFESLLLLIS